VLIVQKALKREFGLDFSSGPGFFGPRTKDAYARWQRKMGFTGADADGIPGKKNLTRLGTKHNFIVVA
jgi:peptidoglycan hydrolase-like protein with peptidoglycan-binding domain